MARAATALLLAALAASVLLATPAATQSVQDIIDSAIKTAQDAVAQAQAQAAAVSNSVATGTTSSSSSATGTGLVGGVPASTCGTLSKTQSSSCANGKCCAVSQQVSACKGRLTATSTVNGKSSTCCVVLLDTKYKNRPAFFCAAPYKKGEDGTKVARVSCLLLDCCSCCRARQGGSCGRVPGPVTARPPSPQQLSTSPHPTRGPAPAGVNYQLPSSAKIRMSPSCTSKNGNAAGTSTCTVEVGRRRPVTTRLATTATERPCTAASEGHAASACTCVAARLQPRGTRSRALTPPPPRPAARSLLSCPRAGPCPPRRWRAWAV